MKCKTSIYIGLFAATVAIASGGNRSGCSGGCPPDETCIGSPFIQPVKDSQCRKCASGQDFWPCNFETLCFCNDAEKDAPRVPPAPKSGEIVSKNVDPCEDHLTKEIFDAIVRPSTPETQALFTYGGLCAAIRQYNDIHDEKFAQMGEEWQMRGELAAFLAHAATDTFGYSTSREARHCVDPITAPDGRVYCMPCKEENFDGEAGTCSAPLVTLEMNYTDYCDSTRMHPHGCDCEDAKVENLIQTSSSSQIAEGYIDASHAYFTRGALSISWNYDYFGASVALTGYPDALCENPDLVSRVPEYAWGVGIYRWMEQMKFGSTGPTAHQQILKGNFGGTVEVLYGKLECPSNKQISEIHADMVEQRVKELCMAGLALGVYLEMDPCRGEKDCHKCEGLQELYESCLEGGTCPACAEWSRFARSTAPTVTKIRIEPPSDWGNWADNRGNTNGAVAKSQVRIGTTATFTILLATFAVGTA